MKGHRSLYQSLFADENPVQTPAPPERRGRSEVLKQRQNELIICRYYYYVKISNALTEKGRSVYDQTLERLQGEVFLTARTIIDILQRESSHLKMLHQAKPDIKYFEKKYPFMKW